MKIEFTNETKEAIIKEQTAKGLFFIEEQRHYDGNFLVFDTKPKPTEQIDTLETLAIKVKALQVAVAKLEKIKK